MLGPLSKLAPLTAVRGNNDLAGESAELPALVVVALGGQRIAVVHRLIDAPATGWDVLVYGHCHRMHADREGDRWLFNPGAAGRRGFHVRRSVAVLEVEPGTEPRCRFIDLGGRRADRVPLKGETEPPMKVSGR